MSETGRSVLIASGRARKQVRRLLESLGPDSGGSVRYTEQRNGRFESSFVVDADARDNETIKVWFRMKKGVK